MGEQIVTEATARELMRRLDTMERKLDMLIARQDDPPAGGNGKYADTDLCELFIHVFARYRDNLWDVAQLRTDGLVRAADTHALGRALGAVSTRGGCVGAWKLQRFDGGNRGKAWKLERRW